MDVVCGRCRAEYEFDDALISERGTTVRCTNCGLQFKVFPPVGQRAPEVWRVFNSSDRHAPPTEYSSLRDLQKAIARGEVRGEHLLSRGGDEPRPLGEIVELQPLLQQPHSEPPPAMSDADVQVPAGPPTGAAESSATVLGVAHRPDPAIVKASRAAPAPPVARSAEEQHEQDTSAQDAPRAPLPPVAGALQENKPKIRSALSLSPPSQKKRTSTPPPAPQASDSEPPSSDSRRASLAPPRQSLRSTLSGSFPTTSEAGVPPSESPLTEDHQDRAATAPTPPEPEAPVQEPPRVEAASASTPEVSAPGVIAPVEPEITDSGEFPGQLTPTPSGMRAYRSPDADPVSSVAGVPVKRRARSGGVVLAVLLGGAAFLGFANRDRIAGYLSGAQQSSAERAPKRVEVSEDLVLRLERADVAWISDQLLRTPESEFDGGPQPSELQSIEKDLVQAGAKTSWYMVNLKRATGEYGEARELAGQLKKGAEQSYALALLDLIEAAENPPWPVILERLKEASTGERGRFLARTVYIYALAKSGDVPRAKADFDAFGQIAGAKDSPLYSELKQFLAAQWGEEDEEELAADTEKPPADEAVEPSGELESDEEPEPGEKVDPEPEREKEAEPPKEPEKKPDPSPEPKPSQVSAAIKAKVEQADAMWRGGNQDGALAIYRQVVAEIGTKHFLGQRSAARIRQAERERASGQ